MFTIAVALRNLAGRHKRWSARNESKQGTLGKGRPILASVESVELRAEPSTVVLVPGKGRTLKMMSHRKPSNQTSLLDKISRVQRKTVRRPSTRPLTRTRR